MEADRPGYWESYENGGYAMRGDLWPTTATAPAAGQGWVISKGCHRGAQVRRRH
ncbi:MAG: hypothetical protein U0871_06660 [Gemmataceae bacterium]